MKRLGRVQRARNGVTRLKRITIRERVSRALNVKLNRFVSMCKKVYKSHLQSNVHSKDGKKPAQKRASFGRGNPKKNGKAKKLQERIIEASEDL